MTCRNRRNVSDIRYIKIVRVSFLNINKRSKVGNLYLNVINHNSELCDFKALLMKIEDWCHLYTCSFLFSIEIRDALILMIASLHCWTFFIG